jgi:two-component system, response regulator YesN
MRNILHLKSKANSLFIQLLLSFLIIIVLLASFNIFSFTFFKGNIREEIIKYNNANLKNTTENYESYFQLLNTLVLNFYFNTNIDFLNRNRDNYEIANHIVHNEIKTLMSNPTLFLDNLVMNYKDTALILDKNGTTNSNTMFSKFYYSPDYTIDFWEKQFEESYNFRIYPSANFSEVTINKQLASQADLFPFIVKTKLYAGFYIVAFVDSQKLFQAFHNSINENFYIADRSGNQIFLSNSTNTKHLPEFTESQGAIKQGDSYYFYKKGSVTGFTYVNIIPIENISSQISHLNFTLVSLLVISVALGIIISILFSIRIHNPIEKIILSIQQLNSLPLPRSRINEFDFIGENIKRILKSNQDIHQSLTENKSLLRYYAYTNKLKKIHSNFYDLKDLFVNNNPFIFILFDLTFKAQYKVEFEMEKDQAIYYIKENINYYLSEEHKDSQTFQIENDQFLSIVFLNNGETHLNETMDHIEQLIIIDKDYYFATITVSSIYQNSSELTKAYEQVLDLIKCRRINDETQIIMDKDRKETTNISLSADQEQEFNLHLYAGNAENLLQIVRRFFSHMYKKDATALQFQQFSEDLVNKVMKAIATLNLKMNVSIASNSPYIQLKECYTLKAYDLFFTEFLITAAGLIKQKKVERDHITNFVIDYLEQYYAKDITLDLIAEKLNISGGYLSTYFKEKTKKNFIDFVNEVRIKKAKNFLVESDLRIQDVASKVGYQNMNSFNRMFKKFSGLTPSEFRQMNKQ